MPKKLIFMAYVPVVHRGYLDLLSALSPQVKEVCIFGKDVLKKIDYLRKDLRALDPDQQVEIVSGLKMFRNVRQVSENDIAELDSDDVNLIMPDEDISRAVARQFKRASVTFKPIFLRWDRGSVESTAEEMEKFAVDDTPYSKEMMKKALEVSYKSSDIWRRVGAVLVTKNGQIIGPRHNQGEPTSHTPWAVGDPRSLFKKGSAIEMSLFTHAEASVIAEAARTGIATDGAKIYVTTFPCPVCAKLIAHSGIKSCYFYEGYAMLDGASVLDAYGVKIYRVKLDDNFGGAPDDHTKITYTKS